MALNILVVDDSQTVRAVIEKTLDIAKIPVHNLFKAANGAEGLAVLYSNWIDLVIADINMPVKSGVEMLQEMHQDELLKTVPVVVVSADGSKTRIEQLRQHGVRAYVRKPFTPELLRSVVESVLGAVGSVPGETRPAGDTSNHELLTKVFSQVLEEYAFLFAEVMEDKEIPTCDGPFIRAQTAFQGTISGVLQLFAPKSFGMLLAAGALGVEIEDARASAGALDAVVELMNVVSGNVLTLLGGDQPVFERSVPEAEVVGDSEWLAVGKKQDTLRFLVDEYPVILQLALSPSE